MNEANNKELCTESCRIIAAMGGTVAVSKVFEITDGAVSQWRFGIPSSRILTIKLMRPDLFEPLANK